MNKRIQQVFEKAEAQKIDILIIAAPPNRAHFSVATDCGGARVNRSFRTICPETPRLGRR